MASQDVHALSSSTSRTSFTVSRRPFCIADASIDRLPTVSASQALHNLHARGSHTVSTGLSQLNKFLSPQSLSGHVIAGGLMRGKVTEVFGPSGSGKTAFG